MQFSMMFPFAFQGMILIALWQRRSLKQKIHGDFQFLHVIGALSGFLQITPKLRGIDRVAHLYAQLPEKLLRVFRAIQVFAFVYGLQRLAG